MCRDSHFTAGTSTGAVNAGVLTEDSALAEHSLDLDCLRWQTGRNREELGRERLNAMHSSTSNRCRSRPCGPNDHCDTVRADEARTPEGPGTARDGEPMHAFGTRPVRLGLIPCRVSSSLTSAPHVGREKPYGHKPSYDVLSTSAPLRIEDDL